MHINLSSKGTTLIAGVIGELDHHTAEHIRNKIDNELIKSAIRDVVFDFSQVSFMDSSGIGVVMGRFKNVQKLNGKVAAANLNPQIKKIFEMSGLTKFIPVYESTEEAIDGI